MKILFFIESLRPGGKERRLVELLKGLRKNYPEIEMELVLTKKGIHYTDVLTLGIRIHIIERKGLKKDPRLLWRFFKITKEFKPDIIHVWGNMVAVYAIPAKFFLKIPMINNQITDVPINYNFNLFNKIAFYFSDIIISNSLAGIRAYRAPQKKVICIYNGFDFNRISHLEKSEKIKKKFNMNTKYIIGMVANFSYYKDYNSYIKAAISICNKRDDITFFSVGYGDNSELQKMVPEHLMKKILFIEPQKNIESLMNACDVGVLASFSEGISNTLLEFMALGKPVIATGEGGTKELIRNNINGIHLPSQRPELLSQKIIELLDNYEFRSSLGESAKKTIKENFEIKSMVEKFVKEYKNLCAE